MTRVWLSGWEWECCGDPFTVGDLVDFGIQSRTVDAFLIDTLGVELAATVDAAESHHEEEYTDRVRGRVAAVHAVTQDSIQRWSLRRPGHGAPPDAVMPPDGKQWPLNGLSLGNGVFVGSRPTRYISESVPVPNSAALVPVRGVRLPREREDDTPVDRSGDPPPERLIRTQPGWLVDVDEQAVAEQ